jgi:hypothetical protein
VGRKFCKPALCARHSISTSNLMGAFPEAQYCSITPDPNVRASMINLTRSLREDQAALFDLGRMEASRPVEGWPSLGTL